MVAEKQMPPFGGIGPVVRSEKLHHLPIQRQPSSVRDSHLQRVRYESYIIPS